jgi:hypothetical protein
MGVLRDITGADLFPAVTTFRRASDNCLAQAQIPMTQVPLTNSPLSGPSVAGPAHRKPALMLAPIAQPTTSVSSNSIPAPEGTNLKGSMQRCSRLDGVSTAFDRSLYSRHQAHFAHPWREISWPGASRVNPSARWLHPVYLAQDRGKPIPVTSGLLPLEPGCRKWLGRLAPFP